MPTLALCVIVGANEATELERLLKSAQGELFDEIHVTCTQGDAAVQAVAEKYATNVSFFEWCHDFSAARNFNMQQASTEYVMWLDADDEIPQEAYSALLGVRKSLGDYDSVYLTYNYSWDENGNPYIVLPRERIVRVAAGARWNDPIHEWLSLQMGDRRLDRPDICINHRRIRKYDSGRNLAILKKLYDEGKASPRLKFYYAKDLFDSGERQVSLQVLNEYLVGETDFCQNKAIACLRMAQYCQEEKDTSAAERFWNAAIAFCPDYAEPYYYLGKVAEGRGETEKALAYFREALSKDPRTVFAAQPLYYRMYPCSSIVFILSGMKRYTEAEYYNNKNMEWYPGNRDYSFNQGYLKGKQQEQQKKLVEGLKVGWQVPAPAGVKGIAALQGLSQGVLAGYSARDLAGTFDILVLNELTDDSLQWVAALQREGLRVVLEVTEFSPPWLSASLATLKALDGVICRSSSAQEKLSQEISNVFFWPGPMEGETLWEYNFLSSRGGPLRVATGIDCDVGKYPVQVRELLFPTDDGDFPRLQTCDAYLCPSVYSSESLRVLRRIMLTGVPVICHRSFDVFIEDGVNGFLYSGIEDLVGALQKLGNPLNKARVGVLGQDSCKRGRLSGDYWGGELLKILETVWGRVSEGRPPQTIPSPVPVVIPVYKNMEYLALCLDSLSRNTAFPYYVVLSDAGSPETDWGYLRNMKGALVLGAPENRKNFSQAVNDACTILPPSEYFVLLNSDVVVSKGWLTNLYKHMQKESNLAACGVLSNCDRGWLHGREGVPSYPMRLTDRGLELVPGMKLRDVAPHLPSLYQFMEGSNRSLRGSFVEQEWVAYYATMFRTDSWAKTGALDPVFQNGCEDLDHARRLRLLGYKIGQALDSFIFHFGGISRGAYGAEDEKHYQEEEDRANHRLYHNKWSRKRIAIFTGPAWEKWNRDTVDAGMAGSETWAAELGAEFVRKGFAVTVFNDPLTDGEVDYNGVEYRDYRTFRWWQNYLHIDYVIMSRTCDPLRYMHVHSCNVYVMVHDITLLDGHGNDTPLLTKPRKYGCLSKWHLDYFTRYHDIAKEQTFLTSNGVRAELYGTVNHSLKKNRAVYSSSPDRGLLTLLRMLPRIREHVPDFELVVTYGFTTWKACAEYYNRQEDKARIQEIEELLQQPGVLYLGRVSKEKLAELQKEAKVWLYPTWFTETWCISLVEQGFAGNAVVTTPLAGILTTGGDAPVYIRGPEGVPEAQWCNTPEYQEEFIRQTILLLRYEEYRREVADRVSAQTCQYTWESAAEGWLREWHII